MAKALYIAYFTGIAGQSIGLFYIGDELLVGVDVATMQYRGSYKTRRDGSLEGIVWGSITAGQIRRRLQEQRGKRRRKYDTCHALMRTRRVTLSPDHVTALNLMQTEFQDDEKVIAAYKKYIDNLAVGPPAGSSE